MKINTRGGHKAASAVIALSALAWLSASIPAQPPLDQPPDQTEPLSIEPGALPEDGPGYPVRGFRLEYVRENPAHPPLEPMMKLEVELGWTFQGFVAPRRGLSTVRLALEDAVNRGPETYYASALQRILERIRDHLSDQGLISVYVAPDPLQISPGDAGGRKAGEDLRDPTRALNEPLTLVITTGVVTELRTLASGERVSDNGPILPEDRIDNPVHRRIRDRSPIQPYREGDPVRQDLIRKDLLDEYLFFLSRHPGRRVDASVAADEEPGGVVLDYQVTENRPLVLYSQFSNTGTKSTDYWRERFGFVHNQLTNKDDILSFDYVTAWFDEANAVLGSYEAPFGNDRIRWRIYGSYNEFDAEQVGFFGDEFNGEAWSVGGEIIANICQRRETFLDLIAGIRFENIEVDNIAFAIQGEEDFLIPYIGARLDRTTEWFSTQGEARLEWRFDDATSAELEALGRTNPDTDTPIFQGGLSHAVYLEPLLDPEAWEDPTNAKQPTLAHELLMSVRGQYAFEERLIPQAEHVAGGLYSVRGYPESIVAGDSAILASVEYRYHVPRAFAVEAEPRELFGQPFRRAPQYIYGRPDWDLVLKAFLDAARTYNSDRLSFERDETLVGVGIGVELLFKRNLNVRLDWGFALEELAAGPVNEGSNRLHFVATILF